MYSRRQSTAVHRPITLFRLSPREDQHGESPRRSLLGGQTWVSRCWCYQECVVPLARRPQVVKPARLVERQVCLISDASNWEGKGDGHPSKGRLPSHADEQRVTCRTAPSALTVIFRLVSRGLTRILCVVLGTVNLQFWDPFVPISWQSVCKISAMQVLGGYRLASM